MTAKSIDAVCKTSPVRCPASEFMSTVPFGSNEAPAKIMAGILSLEFLVHAWDYAKATGGEVTVPDALSDYVLGLAKTIITPEGRSNVGFDDPVDVAVDARVLDRLIAYTGRRPS